MSIFSIATKGISRVRNFFDRQARKVKFAFAKKEIEELAVKRIKMRFEPLGANVNAQRDPSGKLWPRIHPSTVKRRKRNRNRNQALVDTGELLNAIQILRSDLSYSRLVSGKGGEITVGVRGPARVKAKAILHDRGGRNPRGGIVPKREFLGFSKGDKKAIIDLIQKKLR